MVFIGVAGAGALAAAVFWSLRARGARPQAWAAGSAVIAVGVVASLITALVPRTGHAPIRVDARRAAATQVQPDEIPSTTSSTLGEPLDPASTGSVVAAATLPPSTTSTTVVRSSPTPRAKAAPALVLAPSKAAAGPTTPTTAAKAPWSGHKGALAPVTTASVARAPSPMQRTLETWLQGHADVDSVAVGVASTGAAPDLWTGDAQHAGAANVVRADDAYGVLSITKTLVQALVLREVQAGRIDLDAPVPPLPGIDPPPDGVVITPRMLLQHTSGLVDYAKAVGYDSTQAVVTPAQLVNLALHTPLTNVPGNEAHYSRTNYHWLGLLLEHTTGRSFGDLVAGLATEFGLTHTGLDPTGRPGWIGYASGGVRSTVGDMARWGSALFTPGRVLPAELLGTLTTVDKVGAALGTWPACPCSTDAAGVIHYTAIGQVVAHGGIEYYPDAGIVVVVHVAPESTSAGDHTLAIGGLMHDLVLAKGMTGASGH